MAEKKAKLTPKQKIFVDEYVRTKNATRSALKAYDTDDYQTAASIGEENLKKPEIQKATEALFELDKTKQVVDNLHKLAISAEDQRVQHEATKTWLDRAIPKSDAPTNVQFNQIQINQKEKYDL